MVPPMRYVRPLWTRHLSLYRASTAHAMPWAAGPPTEPDARPHVRSRFQSLSDPERFALYTVRDVAGEPAPPLAGGERHTLAMVREFRRVPLDASTLALLLFTARGEGVARVIAALAGWVERVVSESEPGYLLLAHSREQPSLSALLAAVHEGQALQAGRPSMFAVECMCGEVRPWLTAEPQRYAYCPETVRATVAAGPPPHVI
jgi:hypothetical protein